METITHNGKTLTIAQWAKELGIKESTIRSRKNRNLPVEKILEPVKPRRVYSRKGRERSPWKRRMVW